MYIVYLRNYLFSPEADTQGAPLPPSNIAEFRLNTVELDCWLSKTRISWAQCVTNPPSCKLFYYGDSDNEIEPPDGEEDDERYTRYEIVDVIVEPGTQKNLRINTIQNEDGGKYRCADLQDSESGLLAEVIVIHGRHTRQMMIGKYFIGY